MVETDIGIKMDSFYEFLCSNRRDSIENIRKMYTFYRSFAYEYNDTIYQYNCNYSFDESNGWNARRLLEMEHYDLHVMIRLMHDSYLAILLQRLDFNKYAHIIKGLYGYFEYSDTKINPPLKDKDYKTKENIVTKNQYIDDLLLLQHCSTNTGDYLYTSSLGSIIEIEKEVMGNDEKVKCLCLAQQIPYGDLQIHSCK